MQYTKPYILIEKLGNNAFAWEERIAKYNKNPSITIPSCITGNIGDVQIGEEIVFEEMEEDILKSCKGLKNFVRIQIDDSSEMGVRGEDIVGTKRIKNIQDEQSEEEGVGLHTETFGTFSYKSIDTGILGKKEVIIFDNHNHALYFWCEAIQRGILDSLFELIHIDEHSDLWENKNELNLDRSITDLEYTWNFTNFSCNVGNYIQPALKCGLIKNMIRIENEYQIDAYLNYIPDTNSILNIDLDIFAPELDHIPEDKKIQIIRNLIQKVKYVTIATSPYFIEQGKALQMLEKILQKQE